MKAFTESDRYDYPDVTPDDVVIDAGCFEGTWAAAMNQRYGCRVLAFEPVPDFFHRCVVRFSGNHNVTVRREALGDHVGTVSVGIQGDSSGLYCGSAVRASDVPMTTLLHVIDELGVAEIAVLKLNVEASEFPILEHMLAGQYAQRFKNIQVQPHHIAPNAEARWETILTGLSRTHDIVAAEPWCWYLFSRKAEAE